MPPDEPGLVSTWRSGGPLTARVPVRVAAVAPRGRRRWWRRPQARYGLLFVSPALLLLLVFSALPALGGLALSLTYFDLGTAPRWAGLENYRGIAADGLFWRSVVNTLYYTAATLLPGLALGLLLAQLATRRLRGVVFFRTTFYLPGLTSTVAMSVVWLYLFAPLGLVNGLLYPLGLPRIHWFEDPNWAMPAIILNSLWRGVGSTMLIYIAGISGIPQSFYESAWIDGASRWQTFRYITLPMLRPTTFLLFILHLLGSFQVFEQVFILTSGGPAWATTTIVHQIYMNAFLKSQFGYAGAQAVLLLVVLALLSLLSFRMLPTEVEGK